MNLRTTLTLTQLRAICYEAERAYLVAVGRGGGLPEWRSVPESVRTLEGKDLHPAPFEGAYGTAEMTFFRRLIFDTLKETLEPHVRPSE